MDTKKTNRRFSHYINFVNPTGRTVKTVMCYEETSLKEYAKQLKRYSAYYVDKESCKWWEEETGRKTYKRIPEYEDYGVE